MKLNHTNLCTSDVGRLAAFFTSHFDFSPLGELSKSFAVLRGSDGFILNLMRPGKREVAYPDGFHVGFLIESPDAVRTKHAELAQAGWEPGPVEDVVRRGHASTTFFCQLPDGILVEVSASR